MANYIIESRGFSATTSISNALKMGEKNCVTHGTRNFLKPSAVGLNDLNLSDFLTEMHQQASQYDNCIAVHCLFDPTEIAARAQTFNLEFYGLCRKSQQNQIWSCFNWFLSKIFSGDNLSYKRLIEGYASYEKVLGTLRINSTFANHLLLHSIQHILPFNMMLIKHAKRVILMEEFIEDPNAHIDQMAFDGAVPKDISVGRMNSHTQRATQYDFLSDAKETLTKMLEMVEFNHGGESFTAQTLEARLIEQSMVA